jgi:GT2 family glycosyltransferase
MALTALDTDRAVTVSVVICAYTEARWDDLVAGVRSVQLQDPPTPEVIVVIDHNEALLDRVRREIPGIEVTVNTGRRGLSGARNAGVAVATGDVVAFLDDDARAEPGWLSHLVETYRDGNVLGAGGSVAPSWDEERPPWFPPEFDWVVGCSYHGMPEARAPVRNFIGTNMSFRRDALVASGGFDAQLGRVGADASGCEETELCIRMAGQDGGRLIYEPSARVTHQVPTARATWRYFSRRCYQEGRSKAVVARLVGQDRALASERSYLRGVIPHRLVQCLTPAHRTDGGPTMAAAVVVGVAAAGLGYVTATLAPRSGRAKVHPGSWRGWFGLALIASVWGSTFAWTVRVDHMTDLGLVSVLPAVYWVAVGLVTVSFWWWVRWRRAGPVLLAGHVVLLVAIMHATPAILYATTRYSWSYKHVGIVDYIVTHHGVDRVMPNLTAYQDWPGFFGLNALFVSGSGTTSALSYAVWAPFVNELLLLAPLVLILRSFTANRTVVWTGVWLFYLGNWIGQDYFSPQAFTYVLYVTAIAVILRWFLRLPPAARTRSTYALLRHQGPPVLVTSGGASVGLQARPSTPAMYMVVVVLATAIAVSHQLTPFMLIAALGGLLVTGRLRQWSLFVVVSVISVGWIVIWGLPFLHQRLPSVLHTLGHPFDNTSATFINLSVASRDQTVVAYFDRALSAALCGLALIGIWRAWRSARWRRWQPAACLAVTPVLALFASSYGTEVVFRVFLFGLPFLALFAASVLAPRPTGTPRRQLARWMVGLGVVSVLTAAFFVSYDGKERMNYMPPAEVAAMQHLYSLAPSGSLMIGATGNAPWAFTHYSDYQYLWFLSDTAAVAKAVTTDPVPALMHLMEPYPHAYLIFSPTESAQVEMTGILPPGRYRGLERDVLASPEFKTVLSQGGVLVLTLRATP